MFLIIQYGLAKYLAVFRIPSFDYLLRIMYLTIIRRDGS